MRNVVNWFKTRSNRVYLYGVAVATGPVLIYYGVVDNEAVSMWSGLLLTVLGLTAGANTNERNQ